MRQFLQNRKLKIYIKWIAIAVSFLAIFFVYQKVLEDAYEAQVVSWIGYSQEMEIENAVFLSPDEQSYEAGSNVMRAAGYEETGKSYLQRNIGTYGRVFFCLAALVICVVGAALELYLNKKRNTAMVNLVEKEKTSMYEQLQKEKEYISKERTKMGLYMENISHQLKTPMAGTLLCLENLLELELDQKKVKKLQSCVMQLSWMKEMTMVLLRLAQIDAGKIWMKRKKEDLTMLVEHCIERTMILAEEKNIDCYLELEETCMLSCDAFWIKEAVENVLKNAIEFAPENGVIRVCMKENRNDYMIWIFNSGERLDKEYRDVIFERFYQMNHKTTNGFGIGLNLSREIVKLHQGTLEVLDTTKDGTTFQFLIPKMIAKDKAQENLTKL